MTTVGLKAGPLRAAVAMVTPAPSRLAWPTKEHTTPTGSSSQHLNVFSRLATRAANKQWGVGAESKATGAGKPLYRQEELLHSGVKDICHNVRETATAGS